MQMEKGLCQIRQPRPSRPGEEQQRPAAADGGRGPLSALRPVLVAVDDGQSANPDLI